MTIPLNTEASVCSHVLDGSRPVLFVERRHSAWLLLCGPDYYIVGGLIKAVAIGHLLDRDPSLNQVIDLLDGHAAERTEITEPWVRRQVT